MAENLELVRQAVQTIKNEVEDGANTAARVGGAMSCILEYGKEQTDAEIARAKAEEERINANTGISDCPVFSTSSAYSEGDIVNYNGLLYEFTSEKAAGEWDASVVKRASLKGEVDFLKKESLLNNFIVEQNDLAYPVLFSVGDLNSTIENNVVLLSSGKIRPFNYFVVVEIKSERADNTPMYYGINFPSVSMFGKGFANLAVYNNNGKFVIAFNLVGYKVLMLPYNYTAKLCFGGALGKIKYAYSLKSYADAISANADAISANADAISANADAISANADAISANADAINDIMIEATTANTEITGEAESENGYYNYKGAFIPFSSYRSIKFAVEEDAYYSITSSLNGSALHLALFVDKNGTVLSRVNVGENGIEHKYNDYVIKAPAGAVYALCSSSVSFGYAKLYTTKVDIVKETEARSIIEETIKEAIPKESNNWKGKTIVWYGTSIPAQGYPRDCASYLGATVKNESVGSSMARRGKRTYTDDDLTDKYGITGIAWQNVVYSLTLSQMEKKDIFENWTTERRKNNLLTKGYTEEEITNVVGFANMMAGSFYGEETDESQVSSPSSKPTDAMTDNYTEWRKYCYEKSYDNSEDIEEGFGVINGKVDKYLTTETLPDAFVFDHGHNDRFDDLRVIPADAYNRNYFIGAMNFLIHRILCFAPRTRIIIIGHYTNTGDETSGQSLANCCKAQELLADYWNLPIYKSWEKLSMSYNRVITTNAYWDIYGYWHDSGFNGTNGHTGNHFDGVEENPRQVNGVWVHDYSMLRVWQRDGLHPGSSVAREYYGKSIGLWLKNDVFIN